MSLPIALRSEILKTKRTSSFYLTLFAAAFGPFMSLLDVSLGEGVSVSDRNSIFNKLLVDKFMMTSLVAFPMFIILICTLLPQIEYKNNTWKQVLTSPETKGNIFIAKFLNIHLLILTFLIMNLLFMFVTAAILHFREPSLQVFSQPLNGYDILMTRVNSYIVLLAICTIQFWLGLRFKGFIIPIAIGLSLWFFGTLLVVALNANYASYFPYSFHVFVSLPPYKEQITTINWTSLAYAVFFLFIGFFDFKRRRMNG